jgi:hypothetical protein
VEEDRKKIRQLNKAHYFRLARALPRPVSLGIGAPKKPNGKLRVAMRTPKLTTEQQVVVEDFRRIVETEGFELDHVELPEPPKPRDTDE